jgi:hypothetical protein
VTIGEVVDSIRCSRLGIKTNASRMVRSNVTIALYKIQLKEQAQA